MKQGKQSYPEGKIQNWNTQTEKGGNAKEDSCSLGK